MADDKEGGGGARRRVREEAKIARGQGRSSATAGRAGRTGKDAGIFDSVVSLLQLGGTERVAEVLGPRASSWIAALWNDGALRGEAVVVTVPGAAPPAGPSLAGLSFVEMDPIAFSTSAEGWDKILVNQVLGHLTDPAHFIAGCAERLRSGGRLLVAELVPGPGDPLYEPALRPWSLSRPDAAQVVAWLRAAGLIALMGRVEHTRRISDRLAELEHQLSLERSAFERELGETADLQTALEELARVYRSRLSAEFTESFDLILGASYPAPGGQR
jgi:SAM-dependent methyltransferase